jgi:hypothetical protein
MLDAVGNRPLENLNVQINIADCLEGSAKVCIQHATRFLHENVKLEPKSGEITDDSIFAIDSVGDHVSDVVLTVEQLMM